VSDGEATPGRGSGVARVALVALGLALAAAAVVHRVEWTRAHRAALALVEETGLSVRQPAVAADAFWDPDPVRSRLDVARGLLSEAYDPDAFAKLPVREAADAASRLSERLDLARGIAADALAELPAAWQAAMIIGGATNRLWSFEGDRRLFTDRPAWEQPLEAAARLAPGQDEPLRPLAVAWLETWPLLSASRRAEARGTLQRAFSDPATFRECAALWLSAATDRDEAFSLVPDLPWGWETTEAACRVREDWDGFCLARQRRDAAAGRLAEERVREAADHLRGGDPSGARALALGVVADLPVDRRFAATLRSALANCPPGPLSVPAQTIRRWLDLALEGSVRGQAWLPPEVVARIAASAADLPSPTAALAALASGDLTGAEVIERRAEAGNTEPWAQYWVAKALVLARGHRLAEARAALRRVNRSWAVYLPVIEARVAVAQAGTDESAKASAQAELDGAAAAAWRGTDWVWHGQVASLDMCAARDASGFDITLDSFPPRGTVAQVSLDGSPVAVGPAFDPEGVSVSAPVSRGPHLVEITAIAGGRIVPANLTLHEDGQR